MTIEHASEWLVIINSAVLLIFLIVGIIALSLAISLLIRARRVAKKAEELTDKVSAVGTAFQNVAATFSVGGIVSQIIRAVSAERQGKYKSKKK